MSILIIFTIFAAGSLFDDIYADNAFLGGGADDYSYNMVRDSVGNMYFLMDSDSDDIHGITKTELPYSDNSGVFDLALIKMNPALTRILEGTYIGGSGNDEFAYIAIDSNDNIFVTARTTSTNLANVAGAPQTTYGGGPNDSFITKLDSSLNVLQTTYLGGSGAEFVSAIDIDSNGFVFVSGRTNSNDYPFATGNYTSNAGGSDVFITKLNNTLTGTPISTYYGSTDIEFDAGMVIDGSDNIFVSGRTNTEDDLPGVQTGVQKTRMGNQDGFVVKFNNDLKNFTAATYFGGSSEDITRGMGVDDNDNIFVVTRTTSTDFNGANLGVYQNHTALQDIALSKFDNNLTSIVSTYFGGDGNDDTATGFVIEFDASNNVYIAGNTASTNLPNTTGAVQQNKLAEDDIFVAKFSNNLNLNEKSTYIGGNFTDGTIGGLLILESTLYISFDTLSGTDGGCHPEENNVFVGTLSIFLLYTGDDFFLNTTCNYVIDVESPIISGGSGSNGCSDCIDPTFYYSQHKIIVENGFRYNDYSIDVTDRHTASDLIITPTNYTNYVTLKVYDNSGTDNIKWIDVGFGSPRISSSFEESEVTIETKFSDSSVVSSKIKDELNLIDFGSVASSIVDCGYIAEAECLQITIPHTFRDSLINNGIHISATDYDGNEKYHFINEGIKIIGSPLNELPTDRIFTKKYLASHAEWIDLVRIDRVNDIWISEEGLEFKRTDGNGFQRMNPLGFAE